MIATGIVRKIDDLGRLVIPRAVRKKLNIHEGDTFEMFLDNDKIIWKKSIPDEMTVTGASVATAVKMITEK